MNLKTITLGIALAAAAALAACTQNKWSAPPGGYYNYVYITPHWGTHAYDVNLNPLSTRSDLQKAAVDILRPLLPYYSDGKARLHQGYTGASYPDSTAEMEDRKSVV